VAAVHILEKILDHPWQFAVACVGLAILLWQLSRAAKGLLAWLPVIPTRLLAEFRPKKDRSFAERMNVVLVMTFLILLLFAMAVELGPSAIKQVFGGLVGPDEQPHLAWALLAALVFFSILSPVSCEILDRQRRARPGAEANKSSGDPDG
jgi:hypothetical protein